MTSNGRNRKIILLISLIFIVLDILLLLSIYVISRNADLADANNPTPEVFPEARMLTEKTLSFQELTDYFTKVAKDKGGVYAFAFLKQAPLPPNTDTHLLAHAVGDILYQQQGIQGIYACTQDFRNACSHSIVIALFRKDGLEAIPKIAEVCKKAPGGNMAYPMCFHGLGHGVLAYADYDLEKAVDLCSYTGTDQFNNIEFIECTGGAVMEMMSGVHDVERWLQQKPKYFSEDDPLAPCNTDIMPNETKSICYIYLTPHLLEAVGTNMSGTPTDENIAEAFQLCNAIPLEQRVSFDACYGGFGKEFVTIAQNRDIRKIGEMNARQLSQVYDWCLLADKPEGKSACVNFSIGSLFWGGAYNRNAALTFCAVVHNVHLKSTCYSSLIDTVGKNITEKNYRNSFCAELPRHIRSDCKKKLAV